MKTNETSKSVAKIEDVRLAMQIYLMVGGDKEKINDLIEILKTL